MGGDATRVIDKMPDNFQWLGPIAMLFPRARVIVCRRDLRDVGLSCYLQHFGDNLPWAASLADIAWRAQAFDRLVSHWRAVLPLDILEVQYEDLVHDLESESRRLIEFLGLEWDPACLAFHETERTVMTASHGRCANRCSPVRSDAGDTTAGTCIPCSPDWPGWCRRMATRIGTPWPPKR